ncbi:MAG: RnfABCDGE type electron transport complex subunit G [Clostridia bacterium]|nr:RnfABCDGE type electron transport complex subunit G [Clostridia bacterium]
MKDIFKLGIILFLFCVVSAFALGLTNEVTKDPIAENVAEANRQSRIAVFPDATDFTLIASADESVEGYEPHPNAASFIKENPIVSEVYLALDASNTPIGYVIKTLPNGYGGAVTTIIGFTMDGVITGVRVADHQETPGLGAKAKTEDYYNQYNNLMADGNIQVIKEDVKEGQNAITAITSATITSKAVTSGVNMSKAVLDAFK